MSNSSAVSPTSHTGSLAAITDGLRTVHDKGFGLFMGMATSVLDLAKPYVIKAVEIYERNQRLANTGGAIVALGGWYYAPWTLLYSICCIAAPVAYCRDPPGLSSDGSSPGANVADNGGRGGATVLPNPPALLVAGERRAVGVSEDTREAAIKLMKVFTSVLEVTLNIRDRAVLAARVNAETMKGFGGGQYRYFPGLTKIMTDSHFRMLVSHLVGNYREYDDVIGSGSFNVIRHDYKQLANIFLSIAESTGGNLDDQASKEIQCYLINEWLQGLGEPLTKEARKNGIKQMLADDCHNVYRELQDRARNTPLSDSKDSLLSHQPVRSAGAKEG